MKNLAIPALVLLASASLSSAAVYSQNFTFADGTTGAGLGDGSSINGGGDGGYVPGVRGNSLEITSAAATGTTGTFVIPALASSSQGFTVTFDLLMQDTAGGNPPADGLSFTYGNTFNSAALFGEEGPGGTNSISWVVDTWDNGQSDRGIRSKVNGNNDFVQLFAPLADGATLQAPVTLSWSPANGMSMQVGTTTFFSNRAITGFTAGDDYLFAFGARTGGATETVRIDNLVITSVPEPGLLGLLSLGSLAALRRRRA